MTKRIKLVLVCVLVGLHYLAAPALAVNVTVNAGQTLAVMPDAGLGIHTSVYDNQNGNAALPGLLQEAGISALRYSGGGYADVFHWSITRASWENGITGGGLSPWWGQSGNFGYVGPNTDFGRFAQLLDAANSQAIITVNYGSAMKLVGGQSAVPDYAGQPKEAAAWVAYANADPSIYGTANDINLGTDAQGNNWKTAGYWAKLRASTQAQYTTWATADGVYNSLNAFLAIDRDASMNIKYWEIGNETFGTGYYSSGTNGYSVNYNVAYPYTTNTRYHNANLSPAKYGQDVNSFSALMKSVDPTIKIGAVVSTPPGDYSWDSYSGKRWSNEVLSQCAPNIDFVIAHWYPWAGDSADGTSLLSQVRTNIPLMINGQTPGMDTGTTAGIRDWINTYRPTDGNNVEIIISEFGYTGSLSSTVLNSANACFVADSYATWLDLGVTNIDYLEMNKTAFLGDSNPLVRGSAFHAISIINKMEKPGDDIVSTASDGSLLRTHAALQADGTMAVMLINTDTNSATANIIINGDTMTANGLRYSTNGSGSSALTPTAVSGLGNSFTVSNMPGRTTYLYLLTPIPQVNATWALSGDGAWGTGTNWNWNRAPKAAGDTAILGNSIGSATANITLDGDRTFGSLTFSNTSSGTFTISSGSSIPTSKLILANTGTSPALITNSTGNNTITTPVELASNTNISVAADKQLEISGQISESGGSMSINKSGLGVVILSGSSTYTGGTTISAGVLELASTGQLLTDSAIFTDSAATFMINGGSHAVGDISGTGITSVIDGDLTANSIMQGTVIIGAGAKIIIAPRSTGPMALRDKLLSVPEPSTLTLLGIGAGLILFTSVRRRQRR